MHATEWEENAGQEARRMNEIRTARLSRTLEGKKSVKKLSPTPRSHGRSAGFPDSNIDEENEDGAGAEGRLMMNKRTVLMRAHSGSTIDDVEALFRRRESSLTRLHHFRSVRIPTDPERISNVKKTRDKEKRSFRMTPPPTFGFESFNRFIRHLMPAYSPIDPNQHNRSGGSQKQKRHRARTITVCTRVQLKVTKSPSPKPRNRSETDNGSRSSSKIRRKFSPHQTSKSTSSTGSLSPKATCAGNTLGEPPLSPLSPGSPLSPSYTDGKFTVLIIGSTGVGKTALINRFVQEDSKKMSPLYDPGLSCYDNTATVMVDGEEAEFRFIEVNNQKSDLWLSLSGAAFVILYNFDDTCSFHNATDVIARLRERPDTATKPIALVSNKQTLERKRFVITNDDGRQVAKQNDCSFYEVYVSAGRSAVDLLQGVALSVRHYYLQREADQTNTDGGATPSEDISPPLFDYTSSAVASLGIGLLQPRTSRASSTFATTNNKSSSLAGFGNKLWPRKKVKLCRSADVPAVTDRAHRNVSLVSGLQNCFLGMRRGSRSLDAFPVFAKTE